MRGWGPSTGPEPCNRVQRGGRRLPRSRFLALAAFAVAFGFLEAAVVVDLRRLVDPTGELFPRVILPADLLRLEMGREAATMVLLALAAWLSGRDRTARFAAFLVVFGLWDLVYYAVLRFSIGWPARLGALDLLFLVPLPWLGPVWAPMLVAATMIVCGGLALFLLSRHGRFPVRPVHVLGATVGGAIIVSSFLRPNGEPPARYRAELLLLGLGIGIVAYGDVLRRLGLGVHSQAAVLRPAAASSIGGAPTSTAPVRPAPRPPDEH